MIAAAPRNTVMIVVIAALSVFAAMFAVIQLDQPTQKRFLSEGGPVELISALSYLVCIALMFMLWPLRLVAQRWYFVVLLALFSAREFDLDKSPFTLGLLKARQYTSGDVPLPELIISAALLIGIIATCLILLWRQFGPALRGALAGRMDIIAALIGVMFIGVYKAIDGLARKLEPFGITLGDDLNSVLGAIEEVGELGIGLMFGIAIWLYSHRIGGRT